MINEDEIEDYISEHIFEELNEDEFDKVITENLEDGED